MEKWSRARADPGFEVRGGANGLDNFENRGGGGGGGGEICIIYLKYDYIFIVYIYISNTIYFKDAF